MNVSHSNTSKARDTLNPSAPNGMLMAMEFRAPWEASALIPAWPMLRRAPAGDGHPVIVFPGLSASDASTAPLRGYLQGLGYAASGWNQNFNFGPRAGVLDDAAQLVLDAFGERQQKVSLIGWSLGGIYARELAKLLPHAVRDVITMGTPFAGSPRSTNAWRVYELTRGRNVEKESHKFDLPTAPGVPTTSIFSRTDGVVAWQASLQAPCRNNPNTENVEVYASHIGIGLNPTAWWVVADRLAQQPSTWRPFERKRGLQGLLFPDPAR